LAAPGKSVTIKEVENHEKATISAYTDGSKCQRGVGSGVVIFKGSDIIARQKLKLRQMLEQPGGAISHTKNIGRDRITEQAQH